MRKVYLYGADFAAENYLTHFPNLKIQGFIDRNIQKQEKGFMGLPVYSVKELLEKEYDQIIITSIMYTKEMLKILEVNKFDMNKVIVPEKKYLNPTLNPLADSIFKFNIQKSMEIICGNLEMNNIQYYLMFGTLLGLTRDEDLIEWDDDIDILIFDYQKLIFKEVLIDIKNELITSGNNIMIHESADILFIRYLEDTTIKFSIDFYFFKEVGIEFQCGAWRLPLKHFKSYETLEYENYIFRIPKYPLELLKTLYGSDWQIPDESFTAADYTLEM